MKSIKIIKVTMTGADDSIEPAKLYKISQKYPFVEWALLASRNSQGANRFPSLAWLKELHAGKSVELNLALHLCGAYVKEILMGVDKCFTELYPIVSVIDRIQINTHGVQHEFDKIAFRKLLLRESAAEFILQYDNVNRNILDSVKDLSNISTLFDLSHGGGLLPVEWPMPIEGIKFGYAGGLSPDNILNQIELISSKVGTTEIWIDMETHIRSNNDKQFDLDKVEKVLQICTPFIH